MKLRSAFSLHLSNEMQPSNVLYFISLKRITFTTWTSCRADDSYHLSLEFYGLKKWRILEPHLKEFSDGKCILKDDTGSLLFKYLHQSDNEMKKDLIHGNMWAQLFECQLALTWGYILIRVSFSFVSKALFRIISLFFIASNHQIVDKTNLTEFAFWAFISKTNFKITLGYLIT